MQCFKKYCFDFIVAFFETYRQFVICMMFKGRMFWFSIDFQVDISAIMHTADRDSYNSLNDEELSL